MSVSSNPRTNRAARRLLYGAVGAALLSIPTLAVADETFVQQTTVVIPGKPLTSFDISWVDPQLHHYFLADRSNASIDIINTDSKHVRQIIPPAPNNFVGFSGNNDTSGPNGVLTVDRSGDRDHDSDDRGRAQIWAGDGNSTVKIIDYPSGNVVKVVNTGGVNRADELCSDPNDQLVMIANDSAADQFVTFISTEAPYKILGQIHFNGLDPNGKNLISGAGGIEQCQWSPRTGKIYLNLPSPTNGDVQGDTVVIDPVAMKVTKVFPDGTAADNCEPAGMALGPAPQILLGCGADTNNDALIMDERDGSTTPVTSTSGESGSDEVWFNPGDGHYFLAESKNPNGHQLGIVDSRNDQADQSIPGTGSSSHSIAADPNRNQAYLPVNGGGGSLLCGTSAAAAAQGCVAIFGPSGPDDVAFVHRDHDHDGDDH